MLSLALFAAICLGGIVAGSDFPVPPKGITTVQSRFGKNITISYREPGICETTPEVKSFAGYVTLPPSTLTAAEDGITQNYSISTFFWFFEARKDPGNAPLSIWINGGPGSSSMIGLLQENGPCRVTNTSNSTVPNPYSWNSVSNMLYIDQPVQTGFSYDTPTNVTVDIESGTVEVLEPGASIPDQDLRQMLVGTFASQSEGNTVNSTDSAAKALWHFAQTWFQEFPKYRPNDDSLHFWTESYGGHYGPAFVNYFEEQNAKIANKSITETGETYPLHFKTLGIINGCIDTVAQESSYLTIANNNTYGIQAYNQSMYQQLKQAYLGDPTGNCIARTQACQAATLKGDPESLGTNETVNRLCRNTDCLADLPFQDWTGRNYYDIAADALSPTPEPFYIGYLNQPHVQRALGVPVNYSDASNAVYNDFTRVGDAARGDGGRTHIDDIGRLLDAGVRVALVYGDRDYVCNWLGGENVSLNVPFKSQSAFKEAGYARLTNNGNFSGMTREAGNLSFSRVFQAGHEVPAYQPEAALAIFNRTINGRDVASGDKDVAADAGFATQGPRDTLAERQPPPPMQPPRCYVLDIANSCTEEQTKAVLDGSGRVHNYILIDRNNTDTFTAPNNDTVPDTTDTPPSATGSGASASSSSASAAAPSMPALGGARRQMGLPLVAALVAVWAGAVVL